MMISFSPFRKTIIMAHTKFQSRRGFTLIEVIIAAALAALAGVALLSLVSQSTFYYTTFMEKRDRLSFISLGLLGIDSHEKKLPTTTLKYLLQNRYGIEHPEILSSFDGVELKATFHDESINTSYKESNVTRNLEPSLRLLSGRIESQGTTQRFLILDKLP